MPKFSSSPIPVVCGEAEVKSWLFGLALLSVSSIPAHSAPADDSKRAEAEAILDRATKEYGGLDRLAKLQVIVEARYKSPLDVKDQNAVFCKISWQRHNRLRLDEDGPNFKAPYVRVIDGDEAWSIVLGKLIENNKREAAATYNRNRCLAFGPDLLVLKEEGYTLTPLGKTKIDDQVVVGIKAFREGYVEQTLYFDKDTGLLIKRSLRFPMRETGKAGGFQVEVRFEDYKEVGKIRYAAKARVIQGNNEWEFVVDKFTVVEKIDDELFKKPE